MQRKDGGGGGWVRDDTGENNYIRGVMISVGNKDNNSNNSINNGDSKI